MMKQLARATLLLAVFVGPAHARPPTLKGSATWTVNAPEPCGAFSTLVVHTTEADVDVIEVLYQFGNSCDGSFHFLQGSAAGTVSGNLNRLTLEASVPTGDGRTFAVDVTLQKRKGGNPPPPPGEKVVSARASGTVVLDGANLTGGVPTDDAVIRRVK
jgi:hypothetical protein